MYQQVQGAGRQAGIVLEELQGRAGHRVRPCKEISHVHITAKGPNKQIYELKDKQSLMEHLTCRIRLAVNAFAQENVYRMK
jgi:hypothetical protein